MKRLLIFTLALCFLLTLCACGNGLSDNQTFSFAKAQDLRYLGLTFSAQYSPAHIFSTDEYQDIVSVLEQGTRSNIKSDTQPLFLLEYVCAILGETPVRQYLEFCRQDGRTYCKKYGDGSWYLLPDALAQIWKAASLEADFLYNANRAMTPAFEGCPESVAEYRIPQSDAASPQEAVELLFGAFLDALRKENPQRTFTILDVKSTTCSIYDQKYIEAHPDNDWGYAGSALDDNQWVTFCSAGVSFSGKLDTFGVSFYGEESGAGDLRWGNLRLENGEYIFLPCEDAVYASGLLS